MSEANQTTQVEKINTGTLMDSVMAAAVKEGAAEHRKFLDGEIDWDEYVSRRDVILTKHGF